MEVSRPFPPGEYYFSAPTSPSHLSQFYSQGFDDLLDCGGDGLSSAVPFDWEEKPGTPKSPLRTNNCDDFAFDLSRNSQTASLSAEELFDGGVIKPLKPPPRLQFPPAARNGESVVTSPRTSVSHTRKIIRGALFSPRHKDTTETDPFAAAAAAAQRGPSTRRVARSLSPIRDRRFSWKEAEEEKRNYSPAVGKCHKKWKLKDFFLFRSASEGRAAGKDSLKKYTAALSFGAVEASESGSGSGHGLRYNVNRAISKDLMKKKKKTLVPYKQGIVGRLAFNPAISSIANAFGFSRK